MTHHISVDLVLVFLVQAVAPLLHKREWLTYFRLSAPLSVSFLVTFLLLL